MGEHTVSVCTADHAVHASEKLNEAIEKMKVHLLLIGNKFIYNNIVFPFNIVLVNVFIFHKNREFNFH